jgi:hypothetical protein
VTYQAAFWGLSYPFSWRNRKLPGVLHYGGGSAKADGRDRSAEKTASDIEAAKRVAARSLGLLQMSGEYHSSRQRADECSQRAGARDFERDRPDRHKKSERWADRTQPDGGERGVA